MIRRTPTRSSSIGLLIWKNGFSNRRSTLPDRNRRLCPCARLQIGERVSVYGGAGTVKPEAGSLPPATADASREQPPRDDHRGTLSTHMRWKLVIAEKTPQASRAGKPQTERTFSSRRFVPAPPVGIKLAGECAPRFMRDARSDDHCCGCGRSGVMACAGAGSRTGSTR